ncbi:hypothetical protein CDV55_108421 [Aspergillus turcosus]|nr:hypothetical protein CDV55_108421 [Aspergillus turcosus]
MDANWLRGPVLLTAITTVCSSAFLLFGYDQGVMSGVVISPYWLRQMGNPSTIMVSTITALYDVGAVFGAIFSAIMAEYLGRKRTLILGSVILVIGSILMGSCYERVQMMVGRILTGIGIGYLTSVAPVYQSEVCLPSQRGWHICCQVTMMLFGLMLAYWMNYGFYFHPSSLQWRFPLCFQMVFAVYIIVVTLFLPESPRWLMFHKPSSDRGVRVISSLRDKPVDDPAVRLEEEDIRHAIGLEEGGSWSDLLRDGGTAANKRFYLALGIQFMQQMTGINIVTYYAPTLFKESLGMDQQMALFVGGFLQVFYLIASFLTWFMIDRVGRRNLFITMAVGMCVVLVCEAVCVHISNKAAGIAAVFFIFAFEACFTWGWMACVWVYPPEILPLKLRAKGAALAAAADFLGNFIVVEITPPALQNIGYRTYIIFAVFNIVCAVIVWCFYPETAGLSLEAVDSLFIASDEDLVTKKRPKLQWWVVAKSRAAVKAAKAGRGCDREVGTIDSPNRPDDGKASESVEERRME